MYGEKDVSEVKSSRNRREEKTEETRAERADRSETCNQKSFHQGNSLEMQIVGDCNLHVQKVAAFCASAHFLDRAQANTKATNFTAPRSAVTHQLR